MSVTLDAGALIAVDRRDARVLALLDRVRAGRGTLHIPAGVVAQAWRSPRQVRLARLLRSRDTRIVPVDGPSARAIGVLLGRAGRSDIVDGQVVLVAYQTRTPVVTSDADDLRHLDPRIAIHSL